MTKCALTPNLPKSPNEVINGMADFMKARCDSCKNECDKKRCQNAADRIVTQIFLLFLDNYGKGPRTAEDACGGYYCWDWAKAIAAVANSVGAPQWQCEVKAITRIYVSGPHAGEGERDHWYVSCSACGNTDDKSTVLLDDGFLGTTGYYHSPPWPLDQKPSQPDFGPWIPYPGNPVDDMPIDKWTIPPPHIW
jgi:hypothetical protein